MSSSPCTASQESTRGTGTEARSDSANTGHNHLPVGDRASEQTWQGTGFDIHLMGGAFARVPEDDTAFPMRSARYWLNIYGFWADESDDADRIRFVRGFADDMAGFSSGGQYVNFMAAEDPAPAGVAPAPVYGDETLRRLGAVKASWDPDNLFRLNHNILPG